MLAGKILMLTFCDLCLPVDGGWGPWSPWSDCSRTCDIGQRIRYRLCNSPMPSDGGQNCSDSGSATDTESINCKIDDCSTQPASLWTNWSSWSQCSFSCGAGIKMRTRSCQSFVPFINSSCEGNSSSTADCFEMFCPGKLAKL
jgi:Thrombospondin type 1 domain